MLTFKVLYRQVTWRYRCQQTQLAGGCRNFQQASLPLRCRRFCLVGLSASISALTSDYICFTVNNLISCKRLCSIFCQKRMSSTSSRAASTSKARQVAPLCYSSTFAILQSFRKQCLPQNLPVCVPVRVCVCVCESVCVCVCACVCVCVSG